MATNKQNIEMRHLGSYKWIVVHPDLLGGKPSIKGTRISVSMVLECLAAGMSPSEIEHDYPGFPIQCVSEALKFASEQTDRKVGKSNAVA